MNIGQSNEEKEQQQQDLNEKYQAIRYVLEQQQPGFSPAIYASYIQELLDGPLASEERQRWEHLQLYARQCAVFEQAGERDAVSVMNWMKQQKIYPSDQQRLVFELGLQESWQLIEGRYSSRIIPQEENILRRWHNRGYTTTWSARGYLEQKTSPIQLPADSLLRAQIESVLRAAH